MAARFQIPTYHSKDLTVMVATMLPMSFILNYYMFGTSLFKFSILIPATITTFVILCIGFSLYGMVAITLRNRLPEDHYFFQRIGLCLFIFYLLSAFYMSILLLGYDHFGFLGYQYSNSDFTRAWISLVVLNTFLTFLNEGIYRFEQYRNTITETELLNKEYLRSQLYSLKSQMNPHFLFNSLNTLSCLIQENEEKAEGFLNHMSKVYRYLLRNDEHLVTLRSELDFITSYYFLLRERYRDALQISVNVDDEYKEALIPHLTLQLIVENTITCNQISRINPLKIEIKAEEEWLEIQNSMHTRQNCVEDQAEMWVNIANKSRILSNKEISIHKRENERIIRLPLINNKTFVEE